MAIPNYITVKLTKLEEKAFEIFLNKKSIRKKTLSNLPVQGLINLKKSTESTVKDEKDNFELKKVVLGALLRYPGDGIFNLQIKSIQNNCKSNQTKNIAKNAEVEIPTRANLFGEEIDYLKDETKICKTSVKTYNDLITKKIPKLKNVNALSVAKLEQTLEEINELITEKTKTVTETEKGTEGTIKDKTLGTIAVIELSKEQIQKEIDDFKKNYKEIYQNLIETKTIKELEKLLIGKKQDEKSKESVRNLRDDLRNQFKEKEKTISNLQTQVSTSSRGTNAKIIESKIAQEKENKDVIAKDLNQQKYINADINYENSKHVVKRINDAIKFLQASAQQSQKVQGKQEPLKNENLSDSTTVKCKADADCPPETPLCNAGVCSVISEKSAKQIVEEEFQQRIEFDLETVRLAAANLKPKNRIFNASDFDLSRLRLSDNIDKYLEDPIAFLTNNVWNYNFPSTDVVTFNFVASPSILNNINEKTFELIAESLAFISKEKSNDIKNLSGGNVAAYNIWTDYFFIEEVSKRIRLYLQSVYSAADLSVFEVESDSIFSNKNKRFFWFWINQIFVKNVKLFNRTSEGDGQLKITMNSKSFVPVAFGMYFLMIQNGYIIRTPQSEGESFDGFNIDVNMFKLFYDFLLPKRKVGEYTFGAFGKANVSIGLPVKSFFQSLRTKQYSNTNNYINLKSIPEIQYGTVVQIKNSPFFANVQKTLSPGEKVSITNVKKLKKCKNIKESKNETALRLFYKEGNDNILDKEPPELGLGCDTPVENWSNAKNIIFNGDSILKTNARVNYTLPYYNIIRFKTRNLVPNELNILKASLDAENKKSNNSKIEKLLLQYRSFSGKILLENLLSDSEVEDLKESDVLIDNSLLEDLEKNRGATGKILASFFDKESKKWGADRPLTNNRDFQDETFVEIPFAPYVGIFPVGYQVEKTNLAEDTLIQRFLTNTIAKTSVNSEQSLENSVFEISDSQVKYATGYKYNLSSILSLSVIKYNYNKIEFDQPSVSPPESLKKEIEELEQELDAVKEKKLTASFGESLKLIAKETALTVEINAKKLKASFALEAVGDEQPIFVKFRTGNIKYFNDIEEIVTSDATIPISYVDLPPNPLFMQVFPKRGINNKIILSFKGYSLEDKIQTVKVPKKYWTDGWSEAKEFFIKSFKNFSEDTLKKFGIEDQKIEEDEMFFTEQPIEKIKLYFSEGIRPTDFTDLKEFPVEINVLTGGFTKEIDLKPNVKYYFSAKAVSFTGLLSEFSQVYEIELVDDGGAVFPVINILDFNFKKKRERKITFSQKFRIQPAILQQAPNPKKDDIGYLTPTVFSNIGESRPQFKVRLTSKKTGKKVDFNIIYKKEFVKNSKEIAGSINLENANKENVLISYRNRPIPEEKTDFVEKAEGAEPQKALEEAVGIVESKPSDSAATTLEAIDTSVCCAFDDKPPLYPKFNPRGLSGWSASPSEADEKAIAAKNTTYGRLNRKLKIINNALAELGDDEDKVFEVVNSMLNTEKCYLCKRKPEYLDGDKKPMSTLAVIQQEFTTGEFNKLLNVLNCKQFGFASKKGGNPLDNNNESLNSGSSVSKCGTSKNIKVVKVTKGKKSTVPIRKKYVKGTGEQVVVSSTPGQQVVSLGGGGFSSE